TSNGTAILTALPVVPGSAPSRLLICEIAFPANCCVIICVKAFIEILPFVVWSVLNKGTRSQCRHLSNNGRRTRDVRSLPDSCFPVTSTLEVGNHERLTHLNLIRVVQLVAVCLEDCLIAESAVGYVLCDRRKSVARLDLVLTINVVARR